MKAIKYFTLLVVLMCSMQAKADHWAGGYFEYTCLGNNAYQVDFVMMADCAGTPIVPPLQFQLKNGCGLACGITVYDAPLFSVSNADFGCGNDCDGGNTQEDTRSYKLARFRKVITLPYECPDWQVLLVIGQRPEGMDYVADNMGYYQYCTINNTEGLCNSSPKVTGMPIGVGCEDEGGKSQFTFTNPDGGTVQYSMTTPLQGGCSVNPVSIAYEGGANYLMPIPSGGNFQLNSDGIFTFIPSVIGYSVFAVKVQEFNSSNELIGETMVDGIVFSHHCQTGSPISFTNWNGDDDATISTQSVIDTLCSSFSLIPNDDDEAVSWVDVETPYFMTHSVTYSSDGTATVYICANIPDELLCQQETFSITVTARTANAGCLASAAEAGSKGYYYINKIAGEYCPDNLFFTNRNSASGIPMPTYSHAAERIWVGDSMPAIAPIQIQNDEGPIIHEGDITLVAGIEVIIPSCKDLTGDCVFLSGNKTIKLSPNSCSPDCMAIPLELFVREHFDCFHEQLQAEVEGAGPFNFKWIIEGDTIITTDSFLLIHDYVSDDSTGQIPYSCEVYDAVGGFGSFAGEILGTKSFYKPIEEHTIWFNYDPGDLFESGFYYAGQPGVDYNRPFFVADSINSYGPWYGATYMKIDIWDAGGGGQELVYHIEDDLEGGDDWSFNNGEFYWNGYWWNSQNSPCTSGAVDILNYTLLARNCLTPVHQEISALLVNACFEGNWTVQETKSTFDQDYYQELTGETREINLDAPATVNHDMFVYPNPTDGRIYLRSSTEDFLTVSIIDASGKNALFLERVNNQSHIDVSSLSTGFYTLIVTGSDGIEKRLKLVKK